MFLSSFHQNQNDQLLISAEQGSDFAKSVAGDFNPIHNPDHKRFCVPGDLLFSLILQYHKLHQRMSFSFKGMVGADVPLRIQSPAEGQICICDGNAKNYVEAQYAGQSSDNQALIEAMFRNYVAFSGTNFPHVLVPLMREQNVMINPQRPLVIYDSMQFELQHLDLRDPVLEPDECVFCVSGKRGDVTLNFNIEDQGKVVGKGSKTLLLSGLREYDEATVQALVADYSSWKQSYQEQKS